MEDSCQKNKKRFFLLLRLCVVAGACYLIFKNLDYRQFADSFRSLKGWVIGTAVAVKFLAEGGMAFRWWLLLRALGVSIPLRTALRLHFHGLFFSSFLPSSTGGDFVRAWYVTHHTDKRALSALSVFADRFTGLFSTALIATVSFFLFFKEQSLLPAEGASPSRGTLGYYETVFFLVFVLLGVAAVFWIANSKKEGRFSRIASLLKKTAGRGLLYIREILSVYLRKWWLLPLTVFLTVFFQSLTLVSFWLIGQDLGVGGQFKHYFVFFPLVWVVGVIPVSVAGLGVLEGGVVLLFVKAAGASTESAAALAVCQRALFLVGSIPGIFVHLKADYLPKGNEHIFIDAGG